MTYRIHSANCDRSGDNCGTCESGIEQHIASLDGNHDPSGIEADRQADIEQRREDSRWG